MPTVPSVVIVELRRRSQAPNIGFWAQTSCQTCKQVQQAYRLAHGGAATKLASSARVASLHTMYSRPRPASRGPANRSASRCRLTRRHHSVISGRRDFGLRIIHTPVSGTTILASGKSIIGTIEPTVLTILSAESKETRRPRRSMADVQCTKMYLNRANLEQAKRVRRGSVCASAEPSTKAVPSSLDDCVTTACTRDNKRSHWGSPTGNPKLAPRLAQPKLPGHLARTKLCPGPVHKANFRPRPRHPERLHVRRPENIRNRIFIG